MSTPDYDPTDLDRVHPIENPCGECQKETAPLDFDYRGERFHLFCLPLNQISEDVEDGRDWDRLQRAAILFEELVDEARKRMGAIEKEEDRKVAKRFVEKFEAHWREMESKSEEGR